MTFPLNVLKTGVVKLENIIIMIVATNDNQFIGRAEMREIAGEDVLEVLSAVARPTFGTLLYQSMAKYAFNINKNIASSRDALTRGAALSIWEKFYKTLNPLHIKLLPAHLNVEVVDGLEEDESKPYTHAYRIPSSKVFNASFVDLNEDSVSEDALGFLKLIEESDQHFITSYELDGNKWIDEDHPLLNTSTPVYPFTSIVPIGDILIDHGTFLSVKRDVDNGAVSRTTTPIQCVVDVDGDTVFIEGHHRYVEAIIAGKKEVEVIFEHNEYLHGFTEDVHRPDKSTLISLKEIYSEITA